jgi:hypothetical protein
MAAAGMAEESHGVRGANTRAASAASVDGPSGAVCSAVNKLSMPFVSPPS